MQFNKTISTLFAFTVMVAPLQVEAISSRPYTDTLGESSFSNNIFNQVLNESQTIPNDLAYATTGTASWYGPGFYGRSTASGETYRPGTFTVAHRTLPMGTMVRITNLNNGRSAVARVNDRGPYVGGRIVDLGEGIASNLGVKSRGTAPVSLEVLR